VIQLHTADQGVDSLPKGMPVVRAQQALETQFPGAPSTAQLVVTGKNLDEQRPALDALGARAAEAVGGKAAVRVEVARDGRTAIVDVPMSAVGSDAERRAVEVLRERVAPTAPGDETLVTGHAAGSLDFANQISAATPMVIGFVLALAFALLLWAFRSPKLAATVVGLNLLSVGAAFGLMVAVFQNTWAEGPLGFTSTGTITSWLPLFSFVVLFGLSMDYTVLVLERIREGRRAGRSPADAAAEGIAATAGTVTSAAFVMVAIFAVFATLRLLDMKQMGFGLAAAVLLDVTVVRGLALPAAITLLGERGWNVPRPRRRRAEHPVEVPA
jgi:RND superfamily putative drug exporter